MQKHLMYDANFDRELLDDRTQCKIKCQQYNNLPQGDFEARKKLLKEILGKSGDNITIE